MRKVKLKLSLREFPDNGMYAFDDCGLGMTRPSFLLQKYDATLFYDGQSNLEV